MIDKKAGIMTFQELTEALEHIEVDQLHSDIPANVRAELAHMKHNLAAILSFLGNGLNPELSSEAELRESISVIRHECMSLHLTISKLLLLQFFRLNLVMDSRYPALAAAQYEHLSQAVCQICQAFSPQFTEQLSSAF
jgi:hypothetical protein